MKCCLVDCPFYFQPTNETSYRRLRLLSLSRDTPCTRPTRTTLTPEMPKKKKTQLKPIARGFAVTSIPKKVVSPEQPSQDDGSSAKGGSASGDVPHTPRNQNHEPVEDEALARQKAEERSLQDLVEKLQERTEKEIVRTVKVRGRAHTRGTSQTNGSFGVALLSGYRNGKAIF